MLKKIVALGFAALGIATTACSVDVPEDQTASSSDALDQGAGGSRFCNASGYCQCSGYAECLEMAYECKSNWYCNDDAQGHRCCCLNFVMKTRVPPPGNKVPVMSGAL